MYLDIKGRIVVFENKKLVDKISKEIDVFNRRIRKFGRVIDGGIYVSNSKEVNDWKNGLLKDTCEICAKTRIPRGEGGDFNYASHICDDCYCAMTYGNAVEKAVYLKAISRTSFEPIPSIKRFHGNLCPSYHL